LGPLRETLSHFASPCKLRQQCCQAEIGGPIELDLLIPRAGAIGKLDLLYEPADVGAVIEVKANGIIGKPALDRIRDAFGAVQRANSHIRCAYVALTERRGYRWAATDEILNAPAFNLFYYRGSRITAAEPTGDWARLIQLAKQAVTM
jgi:hypothetical protein